MFYTQSINIFVGRFWKILILEVEAKINVGKWSLFIKL